MDIIAFVIFVILGLTAAIHAYWGFGGLWPGTDEKSLARTVIGTKGIDALPAKPVTFAVALAILAAAIWPLMWRSLVPYAIPQGLLWLGMIALILVFAGRGIAGYMPFFQRSNGEQPFARLNRLYFSPLCLLLGAGFAVLMLNV